MNVMLICRYKYDVEFSDRQISFKPLKNDNVNVSIGIAYDYGEDKKKILTYLAVKPLIYFCTTTKSFRLNTFHVDTFIIQNEYLLSMIGEWFFRPHATSYTLVYSDERVDVQIPLQKYAFNSHACESYLRYSVRKLKRILRRRVEQMNKIVDAKIHLLHQELFAYVYHPQQLFRFLPREDIKRIRDNFD